MPFRPAVSAEKSIYSLMGVPLYVTNCSSLATFKILCLFLNFGISIVMFLAMDLFGLTLFGILCASWIWISVSLPRFGKFPTIISLNKFSAFSLSLLLQEPL